MVHHRIRQLFALICADFAAAKFLDLAIDAQIGNSRAVLAKDFTANLTMMTSEKKVELRKTLVASFCLIIRNPICFIRIVLIVVIQSILVTFRVNHLHLWFIAIVLVAVIIRLVDEK